MANEDLCEDLLLSPRHLRRILGAIAATGLIDYIPGSGAGNFSQFRFPYMLTRGVSSPIQIPQSDASEFRKKNEERGTERGQKEDILGGVIRKENLRQSQDLGRSVFRADECDGDSFTSISSSPFSPDAADCDDDIEINRAQLQQFGALPPNFKSLPFEPADVNAVLTAFQQSPVVCGSPEASRNTAIKMLQVFTAEEIERGIVLGTIRRMNTETNHGISAGINALAYFASPIAECRRDPLITPNYIDYCRSTIKRELSKRKQPQKVAGLINKNGGQYSLKEI